MNKVILNKKEYTDTGIFQKNFIQEYCNLHIYPLVGLLEREAGLLSDIAEEITKEGGVVSYKIYGKNERTEFIEDNLHHFDNMYINYGNTIIYVDDSIVKYDLLQLGEIILSKQNNFMDNTFERIHIQTLEKVIYTTKKYSNFIKKVLNYFPNGYDNLICYTMIVKNAGPLLEQVLTDNLGLIDRWCILDTGSTDGTQDIIKRVLKDKRGTLYEEPFVNFKVSRNRCLELAGKSCKFILMLDDTYSMKGDLRSFLNTVRGDQFSDSFSLLIQSEDTEYYSNRIIKSLTNLRYIHTIHEVITDQNNINVTVPPEKAIIYDNRADYMEKRTMDRKQFDLELLFQEVKDYPDDPRALYYIAQTYGCIGDEVNKAKYFEQRITHPVQGYFQEKIDALFELARCYNFRISSVTKEPLTKSLTETEWKRCEELYLEAYNMDTSRPDSIYFIGIHYYLTGNLQVAYNYFKKGFEIGYPIGSQYSLKPTLTFHFLPKFLTELSYYFKNYQLGLDSAKLFLTSSKFNTPTGDSWNLMSNWYKIHEQMLQLPIVQVGKTMDKPIFCFVTDGGWEPWTGKDILTKGMGGSETWIIEMAKWISRTGKYHVVVFCKTNEPDFYENVGYNPIQLFHSFIATTEVEYCIISRYTEYIPVALHGNAKNIGIIFHDNVLPETVIPVDDKIKHIWGLTEWHANQIKGIFPMFDNIIEHIHYGINTDYFNEHPIKTKNSFIYSSFPNRGLVVLLKMWVRIRERFPDATLNIYCNIEQEWVNQVAPEMMKEIKTLLKVIKGGIKVHGWVSKRILAEAFQSSEYFLYPCIFEETFCLTAVEAAISKCVVITNGLAGLSETAKHGITVPGNPYTSTWQEECLKTLFNVMEKGSETIETNYNDAKSRTWEIQAHTLLSNLKIK